MANGIYGTKKPAQITSDDIDIFYHYRPTRSSESPMTGFQRLDSNVLNTMKTDGNEVLNGMYDLRLPLDKFNQVGIYTVYIKPKEVKTSIYAVSTLSAYPNIRGIVLNIAGITNIPTDNGELVGYRVEYMDDNGKTINFQIDNYITYARVSKLQNILEIQTGDDFISYQANLENFSTKLLEINDD
jgi:hypothetical protein